MMVGIAWKHGMATQCDACGSGEIDYADDGTATCRSCGKRMRPHWNAMLGFEADRTLSPPPPTRTSRTIPLPQAPMPSVPALVRGPSSVSRILVESLRILPALPPALVGLVFGFTLAYEGSLFAIIGGNPSYRTSVNPTFGASFLSLAIGLAFGILVLPFIQGVSIHFMSRHHRKKPATLSESLGAGLSAFPAMAGATFITILLFAGLGLLVGFFGALGLLGGSFLGAIGLVVAIVALVVSVVLGIGLGLYPAAIIANLESAFSSLSSSWQYTKGHRVTVFLAFLVLGVPFLGAAIGFEISGIPSAFPLVALLFLTALDAVALLLFFAMVAVLWDQVGPTPSN